jgi:hypothetical protein
MDDHSHDVAVLALEAAGYPVIRIEMRDEYDLGAQFFLWEMATAIAGQRLGIQPFDQPNVEAAKVQARKMVAAYHQEGRLPELTPVLDDEGIRVYGDLKVDSLSQAWKVFLEQATPESYISIQAYIHPGEETDASLLALSDSLRQATRLAITTGYGPRFLHSTGQLHKGGPPTGVFRQLTADHPDDRPIPGWPYSFGRLIDAQAHGDREALRAHDRPVMHVHLGADLVADLGTLERAISRALASED